MARRRNKTDPIGSVVEEFRDGRTVRRNIRVRGDSFVLDDGRDVTDVVEGDLGAWNADKIRRNPRKAAKVINRHKRGKR